MSNKSKGRIAENQFRDILHAWGFEDAQIEQARPTYKPIGRGRVISSQNDLFSYYDFIVRSKQMTMYVQVKSTDSGASSAKHDIKNDIELYGRADDIYIIAQKVPRKGFILRHMNQEGEYKKDFVKFNGQKFGATIQ
jgi:hypothetical protein